MLDPDAALAAVLAATAPLPSVTMPPDQALGLVAALPVTATADHPPFRRAMMDGWAVRLADAGRVVTATAEIAAGDGRVRPPLGPGQVHPIMTGAPVPDDVDAVVPIELAPRDGSTIRLPERIRQGDHIVAQGGDMARGTPWLAPGQVVTPLAVAAAAADGTAAISVIPRPRIAILTTGSELSASAGAGTIRDSNGPMLAALTAELGLAAAHATVPDDPDGIAAMVAATDATVVVLTGGVSAGTHDDVPGVLAGLGWTTILHGIGQRPGKPMLVARMGPRLAFALPGNPLAAHLCWCRYVAPAIRGLMGLPTTPRTGTAVLAALLPGNKDRTWFLPLRVANGGAHPLRPASSADIFGPIPANAYARLAPGAGPVPAGATIPFTWIGAAAWTP